MTTTEYTERLNNTWFKEAKTEKMEPFRQRYKSLEWCDAEDQNPCRVVMSEEEEVEEKEIRLSL